MVEEPDSLAKLSFNAAATREVFADEAKGLRLRIERGKVAFRSATARRGADVIAIERRARGVTVPVDHSHKQLLQRLFRAGLSEERPFFTLEPMPRGWFGILHYPEAEHPPRQPMLTVSGFQPPPTAVDMIAWRRFQRILASDRPIDDALWQETRKMILGAVTTTTRPARGRPSGDRLAASRLLDIVKRNMAQFIDWGNRQPEFLPEVNDLLTKVGVVPSDQVQIRARPTVKPEVTEEEEAAVITPAYVRQVVAESQREEPEETEETEPRPRRPRRKPPQLAPVILDDEQEEEEQTVAGEDALHEESLTVSDTGQDEGLDAEWSEADLPQDDHEDVRLEDEHREDDTETEAHVESQEEPAEAQTEDVAGHFTDEEEDPEAPAPGEDDQPEIDESFDSTLEDQPADDPPAEDHEDTRRPPVRDKDDPDSA